MAKEPKAAVKGEGESYGEVVQRLDEVVRRLEGGELSLEDSLKAFEDGIGLVRKGEELLSRAEKRIEQLLSEDGHTAPLQPATNGGAAPAAKAPVQAPARASTPPEPPPPDDEDVPF